jgi:putative hydrolase of the HAD superfamily
MILVFDLDDTLYEELDFVKSGFRKVAEYIAGEYAINPDDIFLRLIDSLKDGRGTIFDKVLKEYNICSKSYVKECLMVYRSHKPDIQLYPDALNCLERFSSLSKYIVTDGNKIVQANKIKALKLDAHIKYSYITHRYGIRYSKPSDYIFQMICRKEKTDPGKVLYIGDNPHKDFVGIKPKGFRTVRILRGNYKEIHPGKSFEAERNIHSLNEITKEFLNSIFYERPGNR